MLVDVRWWLTFSNIGRILMVSNHSSQYDTLPSTGHTSSLESVLFTSCYSLLATKYLHLLRRWFAAESSTKGVGLERSSKLMMYRQMSSTSLLTGAITSLHRNFVPETGSKVYYHNMSVYINLLTYRHLYKERLWSSLAIIYIY